MIVGSGGSIPRANAGKLSVTRLINKIFVGSKKTASCIKSDVTKIQRTSTRFGEIKKIIVFVMF